MQNPKIIKNKEMQLEYISTLPPVIISLLANVGRELAKDIRKCPECPKEKQLRTVLLRRKAEELRNLSIDPYSQDYNEIYGTAIQVAEKAIRFLAEDFMTEKDRFKLTVGAHHEPN